MNVKSSISLGRGFTFLEMITAMFAGSALLVFGLPMVENHKSKNAVDAMDSEFALMLNDAREQAITEGKFISVCASMDGSSCTELTWSQGWLVYYDQQNYGIDEVIDSQDIINFYEVNQGGTELSVLNEDEFNVFRIRFNAHGFNLEDKRLYASLCKDYKVDELAGLITVERSGRVHAVDFAAKAGKDKVLIDKVNSEFDGQFKCASSIASI